VRHRPFHHGYILFQAIYRSANLKTVLAIAGVLRVVEMRLHFALSLQFIV
jgi:hypothetical protein